MSTLSCRCSCCSLVDMASQIFQVSSLGSCYRRQGVAYQQTSVHAQGFWSNAVWVHGMSLITCVIFGKLVNLSESFSLSFNSENYSSSCLTGLLWQSNKMTHIKHLEPDPVGTHYKLAVVTSNPLSSCGCLKDMPWERPAGGGLSQDPGLRRRWFLASATSFLHTLTWLPSELVVPHYVSWWVLNICPLSLALRLQ